MATKGTAKQREAQKLAKLRKQLTNVTTEIDIETASAELTVNGQTVILPLTVTLNTALQLNDVKGNDAEQSYELVKMLGGSEATEAIDKMPIASVNALVEKWYALVAELQGATVGESEAPHNS